MIRAESQKKKASVKTHRKYVCQVSLEDAMTNKQQNLNTGFVLLT